jgi:hypothetical protein
MGLLIDEKDVLLQALNGQAGGRNAPALAAESIRMILPFIGTRLCTCKPSLQWKALTPYLDKEWPLSVRLCAIRAASSLAAREGKPRLKAKRVHLCRSIQQFGESYASKSHEFAEITRIALDNLK